VRALQRDGFTLDRQSGAHRHYIHPDGRRVTVSFHHAGQTFALKTLRAMIELQARWNENDLRRLALLK
jgi:predicted RNA binding protein YcfA (HicA-like mRNA interferase family)